MNKRLVSLPDDVDAELARESNMSGTVAEALRKHYAGRDASKQLIALAQTIDAELTRLAEAQEVTARVVNRIAAFMRQQGADIN